MKKNIILVLFGILISLNLLSASYNLGSYNISLYYSTGDIIQGWINLSLDNYPKKTLLTGFDSNISIIDFLEKNDVNYSCIPKNCKKGYSIVGVKSTIQNFSLDFKEEQLIGINLIGNIKNIKGFSFDIDSNAEKSCVYPLKIDLFDDGTIDWKYTNGSEDFSCENINSYGCYNEEDHKDGEELLIVDNSYCENINLSVSDKFKVGAEVINNSYGKKVRFFFNVFIDGRPPYRCENITNKSGEIGCIIEVGLKKPTSARVCINVEEEDNGKFKIKYEDVNPCGSTEIGTLNHDFKIFAKPGRYQRIGHFTFNKDNSGIDLPEEIKNYISINYNNDCSEGCMIPIKFISGIKQNITISNLALDYDIGGIKRESNFYKLNPSDVLVSLPKMTTLDLSVGNFIVPSTPGHHNFILKLGDSKLFKARINISASPTSNIISIKPNVVPALVPTSFIASIKSNSNPQNYYWDFGDGTTITSKVSIVKHTYSSMGIYNLSLNINGGKNKIVQIEVVSPKDFILPKINQSKENINNLKIKLNHFPPLVKDSLKDRLNLTEKSEFLKSIKKEYNKAISDEDFLKIMIDLNSLEIPTSLNSNKVLNSIPFLSNPSKLDVSVLEDLGINISRSNEEYTGLVNGWINNNLDVKLTSTEYSIIYPDKTETNTFFKLILKAKDPSNPPEEVYLLFDNGVKIDKYQPEEKGDKNIIKLDNLSETKTIEFLYPDEFSLENLPLYLTSPEVDIGQDLNLPVSNCGNGVCDEDENYKTCPEDCKPILPIIIWFIVLFIIAFIIYIILQEWYKRYYESYLFPNRSQLFNIINFMKNALNFGMEKSEIFKKLKEQNWSGEQLTYAWRKLHGLRTGMWEIPIFKWVENKEVNRELIKRKGQNDIPKFR